MHDDEHDGVLRSRFAGIFGQRRVSPRAPSHEPAAKVEPELAPPRATAHEFGSVDREARKQIERAASATKGQRTALAKRMSRPKRDKLVNFKTTEAGQKRLKALAEQAGISMTDVIERGIELFAKQFEPGDQR